MTAGSQTDLFQSIEKTFGLLGPKLPFVFGAREYGRFRFAYSKEGAPGQKTRLTVQITTTSERGFSYLGVQQECSKKKKGLGHCPESLMISGAP